MHRNGNHGHYTSTANRLLLFRQNEGSQVNIIMEKYETKFEKIVSKSISGKSICCEILNIKI